MHMKKKIPLIVAIAVFFKLGLSRTPEGISIRNFRKREKSILEVVLFLEGIKCDK